MLKPWHGVCEML